MWDEEGATFEDGSMAYVGWCVFPGYGWLGTSLVLRLEGIASSGSGQVTGGFAFGA